MSRIHYRQSWLFSSVFLGLMGGWAVLFTGDISCATGPGKQVGTASGSSSQSSFGIRSSRSFEPSDGPVFTGTELRIPRGSRPTTIIGAGDIAGVYLRGSRSMRINKRDGSQVGPRINRSFTSADSRACVTAGIPECFLGHISARLSLTCIEGLHRFKGLQVRSQPTARRSRMGPGSRDFSTLGIQSQANPSYPRFDAIEHL